MIRVIQTLFVLGIGGYNDERYLLNPAHLK
jgi:hypothetical protein